MLAFLHKSSLPLDPIPNFAATDTIGALVFGGLLEVSWMLQTLSPGFRCQVRVSELDRQSCLLMNSPSLRGKHSWSLQAAKIACRSMKCPNSLRTNSVLWVSRCLQRVLPDLACPYICLFPSKERTAGLPVRL